MADITVVGSLVMDLVCNAQRLPTAGETLKGDKFSIGFGGKGANQCVTAARLGAKVSMVGKVGDDPYGKSYLENLQKLNVNTDDVGIEEGTSTGIAQITVCEDGTNAIIVVLGANLKLTVEDIEKSEDVIKSCKVLVCQLEIPTEVTLRALQITKKHGVRSIFNPAPAVKDMPAELYKCCDVFCPNETEVELITGNKLRNLDDAKSSVLHLLELGCQTALITLGSEGVVFASQDNKQVKHVPAHKVKAIDTTGAGDSFVGSLAFYLSKYPDLSLDEAIDRANHIASISVQAAGTQTSYPYRKDLPEHLFKSS